ncbi:MAG: inorganic diphosphatase [Bryobacteraceae bacterium]
MDNLFVADPGPDSPERVRVVVEIPRGSANKFEYDFHLHLFKLARTLYSPLHYPGDYGFIPGTLAEDGEPLDVLILVREPSFTGCMVEVRPVGMLDTLDMSALDRKVLGVPADNPRFAAMQSPEDVHAHVRREIEHFFEIYKELEGNRLTIQGWRGADEARKAIAESRERYLEKNPA